MSKLSNSLKINKESFVTIIEGDITQFYEVQKKNRRRCLW